MTEPAAVLRHGDQEIELPIVRGTEDELGIDISKLRAQSGLITLDYGFVNTGSCESAITYIDGDAGILRYRSSQQPNQIAYRFLADDGVACDEVTYCELDEGAKRVAGWIQSRNTSGNPNADGTANRAPMGE